MANNDETCVLIENDDANMLTNPYENRLKYRYGIGVIIDIIYEYVKLMKPIDWFFVVIFLAAIIATIIMVSK